MCHALLVWMIVLMVNFVVSQISQHCLPHVFTSKQILVVAVEIGLWFYCAWQRLGCKHVPSQRHNVT